MQLQNMWNRQFAAHDFDNWKISICTQNICLYCTRLVHLFISWQPILNTLLIILLNDSDSSEVVWKLSFQASFDKKEMKQFCNHLRVKRITFCKCKSMYPSCIFLFKIMQMIQNVAPTFNKIQKLDEFFFLE